MITAPVKHQLTPVTESSYRPRLQPLVLAPGYSLWLQPLVSALVTAPVTAPV